MLRFFSKIRFKLAAENKVGRYMRYAIGEIVLVVIGILIALQINNWNEKHKLNKEKKLYIESLINDYAQDTIMLTANIARTDIQVKKLRNLRERIFQPNANLDTIIAVAKSIGGVLTPKLTFNTNTFDSMESSGKLDLFEDHIKTQIFAHNNLEKLVLEIFEDAEDNTKQKFILYAEKYTLGVNSPGYYDNLSWKIENEREFVMLFSDYILSNRFASEEIYLRGFKELLAKTKQLILLLKEEQDND